VLQFDVPKGLIKKPFIVSALIANPEIPIPLILFSAPTPSPPIASPLIIFPPTPIPPIRIPLLLTWYRVAFFVQVKNREIINFTNKKQRDEKD
jgi:hypothetical protein